MKPTETMKPYENIYCFQAMKMLEEGKSVYMLDKKLLKCYDLAALNMRTFISVLRSCQDEKNAFRFVFWVGEKTEEVEDV